jgi:pimeloyl-ACP methyl ester carboxylesterase
MNCAVLLREGNENLVVFFHGLGCAKENFSGLFDQPALSGPTLLAFDLPGHGESRNLPPETCSMEGMAKAVAADLQELVPRCKRLHLVAHSLGGAPALLLAQEPPIPLASFVNLEANLVAADCGLISRRTAETELEEFRDVKFARMIERAGQAADPITRAWSGWMAACNPEAMYASARSLVAWSDSGRLLEIYLGLTCPKLYVYGEKSAIPEVLAAVKGTPRREIGGAGHFMMIEEPEILAAVVAEMLAGP